MHKVECLKRIYEALGGEESVDDDTICDVLHKIGDCLGEIDFKPVYKKGESEVGTWIDGKPIYRSVIESTVGKVNDDLNALKADTVINFYGQALSNYGAWFAIPCRNSATTDYSGTDSYTIDFMQNSTGDKKFLLRFGSYFPESSIVYIIIDYTKKGV